MISSHSRGHATDALSLRFWGSLWGVLTLLALVSASRMYFAYDAAGSPIPWYDAAGSGLMEWYLWGLLLPLVIPLARRVPFWRTTIARPLLVHGAAGLVAAFAHVFLFAAASATVREARYGSGSLADELRSSFLFKFHFAVLTYWALVLGLQTFELGRRNRAEELRRIELDRRLSRAQLQILQAHLRPHFLFNTLNTIAASIRHDPDGAERMLVILGDLLRTALRHKNDQELDLGDELAFLEGYLEIQKTRFGDRLAIELRVDPDALTARVPSFVLQPLVENAIDHGVAARLGPGRVELEAHRRDGRLELCVQDDGPGPSRPSEAFEGGFGLSSTRERLQLLYGADYAFEITPREGGGTTVRLALPYQAGGR